MIRATASSPRACPAAWKKLGINYVGAEVAAGAVLATIYSPEMLTAQRVYLERLKAGTAAYSAAELAGARESLQMLGLTAADLAQLERERVPSAIVVIRAPGAGTVVSKSVYEGQYVTTSDRLFEIADFSSMWFMFDAYEQDISWLHVGQQIEITTRAVPGEVIHTKVEFIDPNFSEATRTTRVRATLPNPHYSVDGAPHRLPHRVLAEGRVLVESPAVLAAPRSAVLDSGLGPSPTSRAPDGRYEQRILTLGRRGDSLVEVLSGLQENDTVVTTGALLLDAQAQLAREAAPATRTGASAPLAPSATATSVPPTLATSASGLALSSQPLALSSPPSALSSLATAALDAADALGSDDYARYQKSSPPSPPLPPPFLRCPSSSAAIRSRPRPALFEPWSTAVADLLKPHRAELAIKIFQCPMAPVLGKGRWVQRSQPLKNPFFGAAMLECGDELPVTASPPPPTSLGPARVPRTARSPRRPPPIENRESKFENPPMIAALIKWSLQNRFLVLCATLLLFGWGSSPSGVCRSTRSPTCRKNQVIVFADWEGRSPREVEDQVTYPLSVNLQGLAGVRSVRATSMFGFFPHHDHF